MDIRQYQTAFNNIAGLIIAGVGDYSKNNHWMNMLQIGGYTSGQIFF